MAKKRATAKQLQEAVASLQNTLAAAGEGPIRTDIQFLNTGSTMLNIGLSGRWDGGWPLGGYELIAGASSSGKTMLTMATMAEAANDPRFDDYDLIYDGPEGGAMVTLAELFGRKLMARLAAPMRGTSFKAEEFYANLRAHAAAGRKFIWVLDSMDSLSSEQETSTNIANDAALLGVGDIQGSYGDGKARVNSQNIRTVMEHLQETNSLLIIICQTRDNFGGTGFSESVYSGGKALRFYADVRMWTTGVGQIKRTIRGNDVTIGNTMRMKVDKNRVRGRAFTVDVPIYYQSGLDDIGGVIDWLIEWKRWSQTSGRVTAPDLNIDGMAYEKLVELIQAEGYEDEIRLFAQEHWLAIEEASALHRKPRYE